MSPSKKFLVLLFLIATTCFAQEHQENPLKLSWLPDKKLLEISRQSKALVYIPIVPPKGMQLEITDNRLKIWDSLGYRLVDNPDFRSVSYEVIVANLDEFTGKDVFLWSYYSSPDCTECLGCFNGLDAFIKQLMKNIYLEEVEKNGQTRLGQFHFVSSDKLTSLFFNPTTKEPPVLNVGWRTECIVVDISNTAMTIYEPALADCARKNEGWITPEEAMTLTGFWQKWRLSFNIKEKTYIAEKIDLPYKP